MRHSTRQLEEVFLNEAEGGEDGGGEEGGEVRVKHSEHKEGGRQRTNEGRRRFMGRGEDGGGQETAGMMLR